MSLNLYEIATEYQLLSKQIMDSDIDQQTQLDTIDSISGSLETKVQNIAYLIRQFEGEADMAMAESKRIADLATLRTNASKRLKEWLLQGMLASGKDEIVLPQFTVKLKNNPPSVIVNNEELIPEEYLRTKVEVSPNKTMIATALKSGLSIAGCHLESKQSVIIR